MSGAAAFSLVKGVVGTSHRIIKSISPYFKVENQELTIHAQEKTGTLAIFANVQNNWRKKFARPIRFDHPEVHRLKISSLPFGASENSAVSRTETGFILNPQLLSDTDSLLLTFDFSIVGDGFIEALVKSSTQVDSFDERDEYWISAQLRHPEALRENHYNIDLRDVDFDVDVAVHQDIQDVLPKPFRDNLELISNWIETSDRNKKHQLGLQHIKNKQSDLTGNEVDLLNKMQDIFAPGKFQDYVSVENKFRLAEVRRGIEFYDKVPGRTFPKAMTVISRTDLSLDVCAADGLVKYKKLDFKEALEDMFPKKYRKSLDEK